jgi:hypothetical protein
VIHTIAAAQQEELEKEISGLQAEAERVAVNGVGFRISTNWAIFSSVG